MSSIEKLKVVGIRSFSQHAENVIEFQTPLTILVGHNGAGKTTIIECLKYATTGEMPPNSKGGAFVHDPKLSRESEVKAQIKLKFRNTRGQPMVVTRSLQLTQSKSKTTLKTLESLLATVDARTGEQVSVSSRCAQLDSEMPFHLGVSKAVLQNVIFCHQEDSQWPLSESSVLKKRFDEIFAAEKYTKALDTLKAVRKQLMQEQKVEEEKLACLKDRRELALRLEADLRTAEERIGGTEERITGLEQEMQASESRLNALQGELEKLSAVQGELERLEHELRLAEQSYADLAQSVGAQLLEEDEAELTRLLETHLASLQDAEATRQALLSERNALLGQLAGEEASLSHGLSERGQLWAEQSQLERRASELEALQAELSANPINPSELFEMQEQHRAADTQAMEAIQRVLGEASSLNDAKRAKRRQADEAREALALLIDRIASTEAALRSQQTLEERLSQAERNLVDAQGKPSLALELGQLNAKRLGLEAEAREVMAELARVGREAEARARLQVQRTQALQCQAAIDRIWSGLNLTCPQENAHSQVSSDLKLAEDALKEATNRVENARVEAASAASRLEHYRAALSKCQSQLAAKQVDEDLLEQITNLEDQLKETLKELALAQSSRGTYEAFQDVLARTHACPLCEQKLNNEAALKHKLSSFLASLPSAALAHEHRRREIQTQLDSLLAKRPAFEEAKRLKGDLPHLKAAVRTTEEDEEKKRLQLEDLESEASHARLKERQLATLRRSTEELSRLLAEHSGIPELPEVPCADEIQAKSTRIEAELNAVRQDQARLEAAHSQAQSELRSLEAAFRDAKEAVLQARLAGAEAHRLGEQKASLEGALQEAEREMGRISEKLEPLAGRIEDLKREREAARSTALELEASLSKRLEHQKGLQNRAEALRSDLARKDATSLSLAQTETRLAQLESRVQDIKNQIINLDSQLALQDRGEGEARLYERRLKDNLALRTLSTRVQSLQSKRSTYPALTTTNASSLQESLSSQQRIQASLLGDRAGLQGELRQLQDQAARLRADLAHSFPAYEQAYRTQAVRVQAAAAAIDDLERYGRALDQAIMRYHGCKMDELNRLLRELWTATYRGADIDSIAIRAAAEASGSSTASTTAQRTYNYRVVMQSGEGIELDMRGRSSAGQRLLASLLIRLALAETFGQACGILALDEPTTNLDRENVEALAGALAELVRVRRQQSNFQLILITHDEEFVEMLGRYECAEYYYRVFKDDSQCSTIQQQAIMR